MHFYARLASRTPVRAPKCGLARFSHLTGGVTLVLEDLRAADGWTVLDERQDAHALAAVETLARIHGAWHGALEGDDDELPPPPTTTTRQATTARGPLPATPTRLELSPRIEAYFVGCWRAVRARADCYPLSAAAIALLDALCRSGEYARLAQLLAQPPRTLIHGDYRPDNLRVRGTGEVCVFDWQFASLGDGSYDLAYFLALAHAPDERRRRERALRSAYLAALARTPRFTTGQGLGTADTTGGNTGLQRQAPSEARLERALAHASLLALASFVIGAAVCAHDDHAALATHKTGLLRLSAAALDWGAEALLT